MKGLLGCCWVSSGVMTGTGSGVGVRTGSGGGSGVSLMVISSSSGVELREMGAAMEGGVVWKYSCGELREKGVEGVEVLGDSSSELMADPTTDRLLRVIEVPGGYKSD